MKMCVLKFSQGDGASVSEINSLKACSRESTIGKER
jgi:hypothetical protein